MAYISILLNLAIISINIFYSLFTFLFFFNATPPTVIYTLSLHDALPICSRDLRELLVNRARSFIYTTGLSPACVAAGQAALRDRKSTRLNSSHVSISYAVFCLKKKKIKK